MKKSTKKTTPKKNVIPDAIAATTGRKTYAIKKVAKPSKAKKK